MLSYFFFFLTQKMLFCTLGSFFVNGSGKKERVRYHFHYFQSSFFIFGSFFLPLPINLKAVDWSCELGVNFNVNMNHLGSCKLLILQVLDVAETLCFLNRLLADAAGWDTRQLLGVTRLHRGQSPLDKLPATVPEMSFQNQYIYLSKSVSLVQKKSLSPYDRCCILRVVMRCWRRET